MGIIKMSHHLFKLCLLPVQRAADEHGLTTSRLIPARPRAGTRVLGQPWHGSGHPRCCLGGRCRPGGPRGSRVGVPGRGGPAPSPAARSRHCCTRSPALPWDLLPSPMRCRDQGMILRHRLGQPLLLVTVPLLCAGASRFSNALLLIRSSSRSLLMRDFCCCFFFLLLDCFSAHVSCALFQLDFPSCISATELLHPPVPRRRSHSAPPVLRDARPKSAVE